MTALATYSTGTVDVSDGGTTVTGTSTIWSGVNARPGDVLQIGEFQTVIADVTDTTHLEIPPWGGGAQTGASYVIYQVSPQRFAGAQAMADVSTLVAALNTDGFFFFVDTEETEPDPSLGEDGQYAMQPSTGKVWLKDSGTWDFQGIYKAFQMTGAYSGATEYSVGDVATDAGSSYVWINETPGSGHAPPNVTYWQLLASKGDTGASGVTAGIRQTYSTTTTDSDPGNGTFRLNNATPASATAAYLDNLDAGGATVSGLFDLFDDSTTTTKGYLRIQKASDPTVWAQFVVTGSVVDGTGYRKLTLSGGAGSGSFTNGDTFAITFSRSGDKGTDGTNGAGYGGTSTTSLTIGTGSKVFTTQAGLAYTNGARVRATSAANAANWMEGTVSYSSTTLTMTSDKVGGSGTHADWNLNVTGESGAGDLLSTNNLSDVGNAQAARANLGVVHPPLGRLTLTSATPVLSSNTTGNATIYYTPYVGEHCPIYDGSKFVDTVFSELSQAVTDTTKSPAATSASNNYDLFVWNDSGTLRCTRGPAWSSATARGTGAGTTELTRVGGLLVNAQAITNGPAANRGTYVGTIRSRAADGNVDWHFGGAASGGTAGTFGVWNMYNRVEFTAQVEDTFSSASVNQAAPAALNASNSNRINYVVGWAEDVVVARTFGTGVAGSSGFVQLGVGHDATNALTGLTASHALNIAGPVSGSARFNGDLGFHYAQAVQAASVSNGTMYGSGTISQFHTGIELTGRF